MSCDEWAAERGNSSLIAQKDAENNVCHPERQRGTFSNVIVAGRATSTS
jgi:hypothetical protein